MGLPALLDQTIKGLIKAAGELTTTTKGRQAKSEKAFAFYRDIGISQEAKWERLGEQFPIIAKAFNDIHALCPWFERVALPVKALGNEEVRFALIPTSRFQFDSNPHQAASLRNANLQSIWQDGVLHTDMFCDRKYGVIFCAAGNLMGGLDAVVGKKAHERAVVRELYAKAVRDGILVRVEAPKGSKHSGVIYEPKIVCPDVRDVAGSDAQQGNPLLPAPR